MGLNPIFEKRAGDFTTISGIGAYPSFITFKPGAGII